MPFFFGYGSLVNKKTWSFNASFEVIQIEGWIRQWRQLNKIKDRYICSLTLTPQKGARIDGILIAATLNEKKILHKREIGCKKVTIDHSQVFSQGERDNYFDYKKDIYTFVSKEKNYQWATPSAPILQSYIDVVADGFYQEFGREGLNHFFNTTEGWDLPILNDRSRPFYPRSIDINKKLQLLIDHYILTAREKNNE